MSKETDAVGPSSILDGLNPEQTAAVQHRDGPLRLGAVAGSGKTETLTRRIANLVIGGVMAARILALTFSKKAAGEMNERLYKLLPDGGARVGTFHSFALEVLRRDGQGEYEKDNLDTKDRYRTIVKQVVGFKGMNWTKADVTLLLSFIGRCKASVELPDSEAALARAVALAQRQPGPSTVPRLLVEAYARAEKERKDRALVTFDDMLLDCCLLFESSEQARDSWASRYDYVEQDEAQDVSPVQNRIAIAMARDHRNYMIVGDPAQAIFQFRGADPASMVRFAEEWPGTTTIGMVRNYRCGRDIAKAANGILANMAVKLEGMEIVSERDTDGHVRVRSYRDQDEEGQSIAQLAMELHQDGMPWSSMAVLYRVNAQSRALEEAFLSERIPHVVVGGHGFYERKEIKDLLSYLRAAQSESEWDQVRRSINAPFRYLGAAFLDRCEKAVEDGESEGMTWPDFVRTVAQQSGVWQKQRSSVEGWASLVEWVTREIELGDKLVDKTAFEQIRGEGETRGLPAAILDRIVMQTDFIGWLTKDEGEESTENNRGSNVRELVRTAGRFKTVAEFLEHVDDTIARASVEARKKKMDAVSLMTIHACVHPTTLVETTDGVMEMGEVLGPTGLIATVDGPRDFRSPVSFQDRELLTVTTTSGYEVTITTDHGMMTWTGDQYEERQAGDLKVGDFLRLRVGSVMEPATMRHPLPPAPPCDVRAVRYTLPFTMSLDVAEFFGLMVADGTVFDGGFRLSKRHEDVRDRFADLADSIFTRLDGVQDRTAKRSKAAPRFEAEVCSTFLSSWLLSVGGMAPLAKSVPLCVLRSASGIQARFLRGLFEDGTVNADQDGVVDHVAWSSVYEQMSRTVQLMLLRLGIISSRFPVGDQWRVAIYGTEIAKFRDLVGFVSAFKNGRLSSLAPGTRGSRVIPVSRDWVRNNVSRADHLYDRQNALARGHVSRRVAEKWGMVDDLRFHHETIASIRPSSGPAMCVEVPGHGRFIQNGFDGCNSKGLEWPCVFVASMNDGILPHGRAMQSDDGLEEERRIAYVAFTRARDQLQISMVREAVVGAKMRRMEPSRFLAEAGLGSVPGSMDAAVGLLGGVE